MGRIHHIKSLTTENTYEEFEGGPIVLVGTRQVIATDFKECDCCGAKGILNEECEYCGQINY